MTVARTCIHTFTVAILNYISSLGCCNNITGRCARQTSSQATRADTAPHAGVGGRPAYDRGVQDSWQVQPA